MKIAAISLFVVMYILMILIPKRRSFVALGAAIIYVILGILPVRNVFSVIDWNVLLMIFGTVMMVDYFIDSKMPAHIADWLLDHSKNVMWVTIYMSLFAGFISAFIDNVATLLMVAPVALAVCKKLKISPIAMVICISVSSNLQGAATLVGDTTSIMLAGAANMDFMDFFWMKGRPGMFFVVELSAILTVPIMMILFRKDKEPVEASEYAVVKDYWPTVFMFLHIILLIIASFIENKPAITNGLICVVCSLILIAIEFVKTKDKEPAIKCFKNADYDTILLLASLFVVIGGITHIGIIDDVAKVIAGFGGKNEFLLYTIIVWFSVLFSAFIDNIPYVATMLPVVAGVSTAMGKEPYLLFFGLLVGATLGGNITPIGASANIAGVGMLRKEGYEVRFRDFMRIGVPFTLTAVLASYLAVWFLW